MTVYIHIFGFLIIHSGVNYKLKISVFDWKIFKKQNTISDYKYVLSVFVIGFRPKRAFSEKINTNTHNSTQSPPNISECPIMNSHSIINNRTPEKK